MPVFYQLVYEYQKELRDLCLLTCSSNLESKIRRTLDNQDITYLIYPIENNKINVFFGLSSCLEILKNFSTKALNKLSTEEDFILGIMLGYGSHQQYQRYLARKKLAV